MEKNTHALKNFWWTIRQTFYFDKAYIFIISFSMVIIGSLPSVSTLISQGIINGVQSKVEIERIFVLIAIYVGIDLFQGIFSYGLNYYKMRFSYKFNLQFNKKILSKAGKLSLKSYEDSETYDMINRAQYEGNGKLLTYLDTLMSAFSSIITMISYLIIIMTFRPWIVLCIIVIPVIKFFISKRINLQSFNIIKDRTNDERRRWYIQYILTYGDFYKELKIYDLYKFFIRRYEKYTQKFNKDDLKLEKNRSMLLSVMTLLEAIIDGILFVYIIFCGYIGEILIGNVLTYMRTIAQVKTQITNILQIFSDMNKESLFINQLIDYFALPEDRTTGKTKIEKVKRIKVQNLCYKYQPNGKYVLKNVNFEVNMKESLAIIGCNGSGKTTLIKLLMGFYDDYEGNIYINGIELRNIDRDDLKRHIATLFQDFVKYESTFRENIGYGNLKILNEDERIWDILNKFGLDALVSDSSKQLDTQVGYWFDGGKQISEGQWQKIGLSRAFAKNADVYILDEPNSALDPISEYELSQSYLDLVKDHIGIIIAHKFNNFIKSVDKVILLSEGEVIGQGNHESLIQHNKVYRTLYNIQSGKEN